MSEYQYYEFLAIDRPLDDDEQADVRSTSTRASITATSFVNEYDWGEYGGDPNELMERYYDAHLYVANWGSRRVMFRLPADLLDPDTLEDYCVDGHVDAWVADEFIVLDFCSEDDPDEFDDNATTLLSALVGVRAELAAGDLRPLYLAWLAAYGAWERDEDAFPRDADNDLEPPVPPGLTTLSAPQQALADFLRLDEDLLATAAETSPPLVTDNLPAIDDWLSRLQIAEKDHLLSRVVRGEATRVRMDLLRRFRDDTAPAPPRRTVATLLDKTAQRRTQELTPQP